MPSLAGEQVCLDVKTLHGSRMNGKAVHLLSAYAAQARLVAPGNLALVRRMTLNVIRHNGSSKHSLRTRKMHAALNDDYRFELINIPCWF